MPARYSVLDAPLNDDSFFGRVHAQLGNSADSNISTYSTRSATVYDTITVESDEIGNITNYNGIEFEWNGRRLENVVYGSDTIYNQGTVQSRDGTIKGRFCD